MATTKQRRLRELRRRIVDDVYTSQWREVWFFPPLDGVKGWQGEQDIMFVGLNPSTGHFSPERPSMFYDAIKHNNFTEAHVTDVIKERATANEARVLLRDPSCLRRHRGYFMEEVAILAPRLIVPVGEDAARVLKAWLGTDPRVTAPIPHYAPRYATDDKRDRFRASMVAIRKLYAELD